MDYKFKVYLDNDSEFFIWESAIDFYPTKRPVKKEFEISQSLLDLLYLNMDDYDDIFKSIGEDVRGLDLIGDEQPKEIPPTLRNNLDKLAKEHVFFQLICLDWLDRLDRYAKGELKNTRKNLYYKHLTHIPMQITTYQHGIRTIFSMILNAMSSDKRPIQEKMASLYENEYDHRNSKFDFSQISTSFERVDNTTFTEVLYPEIIGDIIDFFLREIIKRELTFKQCRSCGKYFPATTAHGNSEYCNRLFQDTGKTCKEIGSVKVYKAKVESNPAIQAYNRAYKTHFARIKYKKMTKEHFQVWAEEARKLRDKVLAGEMDLTEYEEWLKW